MTWQCSGSAPPPAALNRPPQQLVAPVLYLMWSGRTDVTRVGVLHLTTFLLLLLSGNRAFGVGLNRQFTGRMPPDFPAFEGSHNDLLILVLHKIMVDGSSKLTSLYSCFLTLISNVSPYAKSLSLAASTRIINLVELFAAPRYLLARPGNTGFAAQLLEAVNNLLQYQYETNGVFVYAVLRRRDVFQRVASIDLASWRALHSEGAAVAARHTPAKSVAAPSPAPEAPHHAAGTGLSAVGDAAGAEAGTAAAAAAATATTGAEAQPASTPAKAAAVASASSSWEPSEEALTALRRQLPLGVVLRLTEYLAPLVERQVKSAGLDDDGVVDFLRATTVVGVLPRPHPIVQRVYSPNVFTQVRACFNPCGPASTST